MSQSQTLDSAIFEGPPPHAHMGLLGRHPDITHNIKYCCRKQEYVPVMEICYLQLYGEDTPKRKHKLNGITILVFKYFPSGWTSLHSHQCCWMVPLPTAVSYDFYFFAFLVICTLGKHMLFRFAFLYWTKVLNIFFRYLLTICTSSKKCIFILLSCFFPLLVPYRMDRKHFTIL